MVRFHTPRSLLRAKRRTIVDDDTYKGTVTKCDLPHRHIFYQKWRIGKLRENPIYLRKIQRKQTSKPKSQSKRLRLMTTLCLCFHGLPTEPPSLHSLPTVWVKESLHASFILLSVSLFFSPCSRNPHSPDHSSLLP